MKTSSSTSMQKLAKGHSQRYIPAQKKLVGFNEYKTRNRYFELKQKEHTAKTKTQNNPQTPVLPQPEPMEVGGAEAFVDPLFDKNFTLVRHQKKRENLKRKQNENSSEPAKKVPNSTLLF